MIFKPRPHQKRKKLKDRDLSRHSAVGDAKSRLIMTLTLHPCQVDINATYVNISLILNHILFIVIF
jgi:hypothetical protein